MNNLSNELPVISADLAALRCDAPTSGLARRRLLPATPASAAADGVHLDQQVPVAWSAFVSWHVIRLLLINFAPKDNLHSVPVQISPINRRFARALPSIYAWVCSIER
jgi:hypothetical protein